MSQNEMAQLSRNNSTSEVDCLFKYREGDEQESHARHTILHFGQPPGTFIRPQVVRLKNASAKLEVSPSTFVLDFGLTSKLGESETKAEDGEEELHTLVDKIMTLQRRRSIGNHSAFSTAAKAATEQRRRSTSDHIPFSKANNMSTTQQQLRRGSVASTFSTMSRVQKNHASNFNDSMMPLSQHFDALLRVEGALSNVVKGHDRDILHDDASSIGHAVWDCDSALVPIADMYELAEHNYLLSIDNNEDCAGFELVSKYKEFVGLWMSMCEKRHDKRGLSMRTQENRTREQSEWIEKQRKLISEERKLREATAVVLGQITDKRCDVVDIPLVSLPCELRKQDTVLFQPTSNAAKQVTAKLEGFLKCLQPLSLFAFHVERRGHQDDQIERNEKGRTELASDNESDIETDDSGTTLGDFELQSIDRIIHDNVVEIPKCYVETWPCLDANVDVVSFTQHVNTLRNHAQELKCGINNEMVRSETQTHVNQLHVTISQLEVQLEDRNRHAAQIRSLLELRELIIDVEGLIVEQIYRDHQHNSQANASIAVLWKQTMQECERAQHARLNVQQLDLICACHQLNFNQYANEHKASLALIQKDIKASRFGNLVPAAQRQRREFQRGLVKDLMQEANEINRLRGRIVHQILRLRERSLIRWRASVSAMAKRLAQLGDSAALRRFVETVSKQQQIESRAERHSKLLKCGVYKLHTHNYDEVDSAIDNCLPTPPALKQESTNNNDTEREVKFRVQDNLQRNTEKEEPQNAAVAFDRVQYKKLTRATSADECVLELVFLAGCEELDDAIRAEPKLLRVVKRMCGSVLEELLRERIEHAQKQMRAWMEQCASATSNDNDEQCLASPKSSRGYLTEISMATEIVSEHSSDDDDESSIDANSYIESNEQTPTVQSNLKNLDSNNMQPAYDLGNCGELVGHFISLRVLEYELSREFSLKLARAKQSRKYQNAMKRLVTSTSSTSSSSSFSSSPNLKANNATVEEGFNYSEITNTSENNVLSVDTEDATRQSAISTLTVKKCQHQATSDSNGDTLVVDTIWHGVNQDGSLLPVKNANDNNNNNNNNNINNNTKEFQELREQIEIAELASEMQFERLEQGGHVLVGHAINAAATLGALDSARGEYDSYQLGIEAISLADVHDLLSPMYQQLWEALESQRKARSNHEPQNEQEPVVTSDKRGVQAQVENIERKKGNRAVSPAQHAMSSVKAPLTTAAAVLSISAKTKVDSHFQILLDWHVNKTVSTLCQQIRDTIDVLEAQHEALEATLERFINARQVRETIISQYGKQRLTHGLDVLSSAVGEHIEPVVNGSSTTTDEIQSENGTKQSPKEEEEEQEQEQETEDTVYSDAILRDLHQEIKIVTNTAGLLYEKLARVQSAATWQPTDVTFQPVLEADVTSSGETVKVLETLELSVVETPHSPRHQVSSLHGVAMDRLAAIRQHAKSMTHVSAADLTNLDKAENEFKYFETMLEKENKMTLGKRFGRETAINDLAKMRTTIKHYEENHKQIKNQHASSISDKGDTMTSKNNINGTQQGHIKETQHLNVREWVLQKVQNIQHGIAERANTLASIQLRAQRVQDTFMLDGGLRRYARPWDESMSPTSTPGKRISFSFDEKLIHTPRVSSNKLREIRGVGAHVRRSDSVVAREGPFERLYGPPVDTHGSKTNSETKTNKSRGKQQEDGKHEEGQEKQEVRNEQEKKEEQGGDKVRVPWNASVLTDSRGMFHKRALMSTVHEKLDEYSHRPIVHIASETALASCYARLHAEWEQETKL